MAGFRPYMRWLHAGEPGHHHHARLLDSGILFIVIGACVVIHTTVGSPSAAASPAHALLGFFLFVVGFSFALPAFVADQFPRAARVGAAIAEALQNHLVGGI